MEDADLLWWVLEKIGNPKEVEEEDSWKKDYIPLLAQPKTYVHHEP